MCPQEIDDSLRRLRDAAERISDALLELELHPVRRRLEAARLSGASRARWIDAEHALTRLWEWYRALDDVLDRAVALHGVRPRIAERQRGELAFLVSGPSIAVEGDEIPLGQRDLLGGSVATLACTPDELVLRMSTVFEEVTAVVAAAEAATETLTPRVLRANASLEASIRRAHELGEPVPDDVLALRTPLAELTTRLSDDPLGVDGNAIEEIDGAIAAFSGHVERLTSLTRELPGRIESARALIRNARVVEVESRQAHAEATVKIARARVPAPVDGDDALEAELDAVVALSRDEAWREADEALERCAADAAARLERAQAILAANRAPIQRRNELRGLLDAYRGKARRLGLVEDRRLSELFAAAHDALYTAPTDLDHAVALVRRYQEALSRP
jgi:hypothetical protein